MRILKLCSGNRGLSPFVKEQAESLQAEGLVVDIFQVKGRGVAGYLNNFTPFMRQLQKGGYDMVHAHYGLSGLLANLQRKVPVVTTFHGSDTHYPPIRMLSKLTARLSKFNIITNQCQFKLLGLKKDTALIPCGVDTELFVPMEKDKCRKAMGLSLDRKIVLFGSSFDRKVKNSPLAQEAILKLEGVDLLELKGYNREEVVMLINAVDIVLITSLKETGPLVIKEALACNTAVISTDVGDVKTVLGEKYKKFLINPNASELAQKLQWLLNQKDCPDYRDLVMGYDLKLIAKKIKSVYNKVNENFN